MLKTIYNNIFRKIKIKIRTYPKMKKLISERTINKFKKNYVVKKCRDEIDILYFEKDSSGNKIFKKVLTLCPGANVVINNCGEGSLFIEVNKNSYPLAYLNVRAYSKTHLNINEDMNDGSWIHLNDNSSANVYGKCNINASGFSKVNAVTGVNTEFSDYPFCNILASGSTEIIVASDSTVQSCDEATVHLLGHARGICQSNSKVFALEQSYCRAMNCAEVYAGDNSMVEASDSVVVTASKFSCINKMSNDVKIIQKNHFGTIIDRVFVLKEDIIVYKKLIDNKIAILKLEKDQVFQSAYHGKCRTNRAFVVRIESLNGKETYESGNSMHDYYFEYKVGKEVVPDYYVEDIEECRSGIHFFLTREEAMAYTG
jgi:hypothetical protein